MFFSMVVLEKPFFDNIHSKSYMWIPCSYIKSDFVYNNVVKKIKFWDFQFKQEKLC